MKLKEVFEKSVQFFKDKKIESARLDAELLISHALKFDRLQIYLKYEQPLSEAEVQACREVIRRRTAGEPVAYIVGERGFYGQIFKVGEGVLIPRPETELIVEEGINFLRATQQENQAEAELQVLDLGAGSGCIGLSILKEVSNVKLTAVERSEKAFSFLKRNTDELNLTERSRLICDDVMKFQDKHRYDLIVANPPYIAENDPATETNVRKFEPAEALFAADAGLADIKNWLQKYSAQMSDRSLILMEIGYQQGPAVKDFANALGCFSKVEILKDLSGLDRVLKATHNS